ncbi:MAG: hypothetical protein HC822_12200, partial [Oscillochloris sp.]|nr:hypothetical protein [Oscillochloris sp.]
AALLVAAAAPAPIALDELVELAGLELDVHPQQALAALAYAQRHPLIRPAAQANAERYWQSGPEAGRNEAEALAATLPQERPATLIELLGFG